MNPEVPPHADANVPYEGGRALRRMLVVGGGRGGVGKSLVAQNLAVYLAQLGKRVVLVDADPTGANLHVHFGLGASNRDPTADASGREDEDPGALANALVPTNVPGLALLPASHDAIAAPVALRAGRKARWLARLRALPCEYVVLDVGPGHGHLPVDLMLAADVAITVTVPEPPAIETTYRFLRAAFRRRMRRALARDRLRLTLFERVVAEVGALPSPLALLAPLAKMEVRLAEQAWAELQAMHFYVIVNQTRVRTDLDLGAWMCDLSGRHLGVQLEELGHVEYDDTVWLTVRRHKPLLVDSPTSKAAKNLERIARRVLAITTAAKSSTAPTARPGEGSTPTLYEMLRIVRSANDEEIRRAYKRQREVYASGGLATASLLTEVELKAEQAHVNEAYDTLLDPVRRRAYDLSTFPDAHPHHDIGAARRAQVRPALVAEQLMLQSELAREIGPDTDFSGALLKKIRESQGIDILEISAKTKIAKTHLAAIEDEDFKALPAPVYVRGFVHELAKFLKLDPAQVQRTYVRRMKSPVAHG